MRLICTLLIASCSLICSSLLAQERTISGRLTSTEDGSPLPGISISIKGTTTGTITDADGYYSIQAPIGSTLVFSFIGMKTKEVVVTENNLQPVNNQKRSTRAREKKQKYDSQPLPKSLYKDSISKNEIGISFLTGESPTYNTKSILDPASIKSIRKQGNRYIIKTDTDPIHRTGFGLQFSTSLGIEQVNKLPSLQNDYAQGQSQGGTFQWRGADQQEIFSWGPYIKTLEFGGSNYPFDKNGRLVPAGTGNGKKAKKYNASSFFRTGLTNVNEVMLTLPTPRNGTLIFDLENRTRTGVIPNSDYKKINLSTSLRNYKLSDDVRTNISVSFNRSQGNLLNRGANLSSVIGAIYRTPVTFDNANGLSNKSALNTPDAYTFTNGTKRTHAPELADNPFGLVNELPDQEELNRLLASVNLQYNPNNLLSLVFNGNLDQQWNQITFGTPPGYSGFINGRLTNRNDDQTFANALITSAYTPNLNDGELKLSLSYQVGYFNRKLNRTDGVDFSSNGLLHLKEAESINTLKKIVTRTSHEIIVNTQYNYGNIFSARFSNRTYFSNTVNYNQFTNLFPSASLSFNLAEPLYLWPLNDLKLYITASRTIREAPLLYSNWSYGSIDMSLENYANFYESGELFFMHTLAPETERKFETGIKVFGYNGFTMELSYFNNLTKNFIVPVSTVGGFELSNAASVKNFGGAISAGYQHYIQNGSWGVDLKWGTFNNTVEELYSPNDWIPIAGFQSIQSVLATDKPVGAIYGTSYLKDEQGRKIIGSDGFPLKDTNLKMIGNPIPDWTLGLSSFIRWQRFKFSFVFDFKKGGETWNGTNSLLDYTGRSHNTGKLRNTSNYIFEGVTTGGNPNTTLVDFYNPNNSITSNRWVRYGWDGIGEDYIEDTSWIRLSELVLSYTLHRGFGNATIKEIKLSLLGRNLFLITPYSGVDPSSSLFGYTTGNGLDLFNLPSTRSYSAQLTIKI